MVPTQSPTRDLFLSFLLDLQMSETSTFDPSMFLDMEMDAPLEKRPPLPIGDYTAVIGEVTATTWQGKKDPSKSGIKWDFPITIDVPLDVQNSLGIEMPTLQLKDGIMLETTPQGGIDMGLGKNRQLRNYREAVDLNKPGDKFSARALVGKVVKVKLIHEPYTPAAGGETIIVERIGGVARA